MRPCPLPETLQRLLDEQLPPEELLDVESHVQDCPQCQEALAKLTPFEMPLAPSADALAPTGARRLPGRSAESTVDVTGDPHAETVARRELPTIPGHDILGSLGKGGMGVVFKARHQVLGRIVAVKVPLRSKLEDHESAGRFLREARTAASLSHPNICPIHEVGESDAGPYICMGYVEGEPLSRCCAKQRPSARDAARLVATLAHAVAYAHAHGVLHRDIKPANVMIEAASGQPILMDFGLAKRATSEETQLTCDGEVLGTPAYMSPEQAAGHTDQIGPAADVYSLGVVLYELLCGQRPFHGNPSEVLVQIQTVEPIAPRKLAPRIHRDLETVCLKAMAKRPQDRYGSAEDLAADLERFAAGEAILARRRPFLVKLAFAVARRPLVPGVIAAAAVALLVGAYWLTTALEQRRVAFAVSRLNAAIEADDWSDQHLAQIDALTADVERHSPQQAEAARRRLVARFASAIELQLATPTVAEKEMELAAAIDRLKARDAERAGKLSDILQRRRRQWEPYVTLSPPFGSLAEVFDPNEVLVDGDTLTAPSAGDGPRLVYLRAASPAECRLEVTFDEGWVNSPLVGVVLRASRDGGDDKSESLASLPQPDRHGYHFLLHTLQSEKGYPSLKQACEQGTSVFLGIYHGRDCLRRKEIAASQLPSGPLRLAAARIRDRLRFEIQDVETIEFRDAFSYSAVRDHVVAVCWPKAGRILDLRATRLRMPEAPSVLEQGDDLYEQGRFAEAVAFFEQQSRQAMSPEDVQAARYRQACCLLALQRAGEAELLLKDLATQSGQQWPLLAACRLWLQKLEERRIDQANVLCDKVVSQYEPDAITLLVPHSLAERF